MRHLVVCKLDEKGHELVLPRVLRETLEGAGAQLLRIAQQRFSDLLKQQLLLSAQHLWRHRCGESAWSATDPRRRANEGRKARGKGREKTPAVRDTGCRPRRTHVFDKALDPDALVHGGDGSVVQGLCLRLSQRPRLPHRQGHDGRNYVRAARRHVLRRQDVGVHRLHLLW